MSWTHRGIPIYPIPSRIPGKMAGDINWGGKDRRQRVPTQANTDLMLAKAREMINKRLDAPINLYDRWLRNPLV